MLFFFYSNLDPDDGRDARCEVYPEALGVSIL